MLSPPYGPPREILKNSAIKRCLRRIDILCITKCRFLMDHGLWRDETLCVLYLG